MHNFFLLVLFSITYGLTGKKGNVHGGFIKKSEKKNAGESKIMIKRSKRNRMRQPTTKKKQARRKTTGE